MTGELDQTEEFGWCPSSVTDTLHTVDQILNPIVHHSIFSRYFLSLDFVVKKK